MSISLDYSSGNGVLVDELPSCIGQGWSLGGLGVITRIQRGDAPDDQISNQRTPLELERVPFEYRYPDGYIFNTRPTSDGCNRLLNRYPIYEEEHVQYYTKNSINADKEQDYFVFSFGGRTGKFVIDKDHNIHVIGNDSRLKFKQPSFDASPLNGCRTLINGFKIIDEIGIEYEFAYRDFSKNFDYYNIMGGIVNEARTRQLLTDHEIPLEYNPFVTNSWYLSKITDPSNGRSITLNYKSDQIDVFSGLSVEYRLPLMALPWKCYHSFTNPNFGPNNNDEPLHPYITTVVRQRMFLKKPEIESILLSNGDIVDFEYSEKRKDCKGSYKLSGIYIKSGFEGRVEKISLQHSYFVKNTIKEPATTEEKFTRLVLQSVNKIADNNFHRVASFEYYTGSNVTEDFVPPPFFHAKDPWGYYNGNYCGIDVSNVLANDYSLLHFRDVTIDGECFQMSDAELMATFNSRTVAAYYSGNFMIGDNNVPYLKSNVKSGYAENGLLSAITNEYGGKQVIQYEQNKFQEEAYFSNTSNSRDINAVGGVHVSAILEQESNVIISQTNYKFVREGAEESSLWGVEFPCNISVSNTLYSPEEREFDVLSCKYKYRYPGEQRHLIMAQSGTSLSDVLKNYGTYQAYAAFMSSLNSAVFQGNFSNVANALAGVAISIILTCSGDYPTDASTYFSMHNRALNFQNSLPVQFKRVEVITSNPATGETNGKTVYEFTSPDDAVAPLQIPNNYYPFTHKVRYYDWAYGLPKSVKVYNSSNKLLHSTTNSYEPVFNDYTTSSTQSCNCASSFSASLNNVSYEGYPDYFTNTTIEGTHNYAAKSPALFVEIYNQVAGHSELKAKVETIIDAADNEMTTSSYYEYNPLNFQVSKINTTTSEGKKIEKKIYYPEDFDIPGTTVLQNMISANMINVPLVTETWQTNSSDLKELISYSATEFDQLGESIRPKKTYSLFSKDPISENIVGLFNPNIFLRPLPEIKQVNEVVYDAVGNVITTIDKIGDKVSCIVYGYDNQYPVATISNADRSEVVYTSFENNESGDWLISTGNIVSQVSPTGEMCLSGQTISMTAPVLSSDKTYTLSFWASIGSLIDVNSSFTQVASNPEINGWKYYEYRVPSGFSQPITITGKGKIDEVRVYPSNARMQTVTYLPSVGKSSSCDVNNRINYYDYDNFGRIIMVRDEKRNIIKTYEYRFKQE